jgi:hypothetical protein
VDIFAFCRQLIDSKRDISRKYRLLGASSPAQIDFSFTPFPPACISEIMTFLSRQQAEKSAVCSSPILYAAPHVGVARTDTLS